MLELKYQDKYGNIEDVYNAIVDNHEFQMDGRIFEFFCADALIAIIADFAGQGDALEILVWQLTESAIFEPRFKLTDARHSGFDVYFAVSFARFPYRFVFLLTLKQAFRRYLFHQRGIILLADVAYHPRRVHLHTARDGTGYCQ
jgi:hypothetical protein